MSSNQRGRRVRVVTDPVKYQRHLRRKWLRRVVRGIVWGVILLIGVGVFWLILDRMMKPRDQE
jgi:hypothetical protein